MKQRLRITLLVFLVIAFHTGLTGPACGVEDQERVIVTFGDSTTATFGPLRIYSRILREEFSKRGVPVQVINAGKKGDHTLYARERFQRDVLDRKPDVVVVQFGINDAMVDVWKEPPATKPRVSLAIYEANLRFFIDSIREIGARPILMTPNPLRWTPMVKGLFGKPPYVVDDEDGINLLLRDYAEKVREISKDEKVPLIDIYAAMESDAKKVLFDGIHPNAKGHRLVAERLIPVVSAALKE